MRIIEPLSVSVCFRFTFLRMFFLLVAFLSMTEVARSQQGEAIRAVLSSQEQAWNRGDVRLYMDGYWQSDSLLFSSGGTIQRGWDATLDKYLKTYDSRDRMGTLSFSGLEVHLLTNEAAWVFGRWTLRRLSDSPGGVFTLILRRFPQGWKIVHDHTSLFTP